MEEHHLGTPTLVMFKTEKCPKPFIFIATPYYNITCSILFYPVLLCGFFLSFLCSFSLFFLFLFVSLPGGVDPEQRLFESFAEGPHHRGPQELEHRGGEVTSVTTGTSVVRSTISTDFGRLRYTSKTEIWQMYGRCMMSMV